MFGFRQEKEFDLLIKEPTKEAQNNGVEELLSG